MYYYMQNPGSERVIGFFTSLSETHNTDSLNERCLQLANPWMTVELYIGGSQSSQSVLYGRMIQHLQTAVESLYRQ